MTEFKEQSTFIRAKDALTKLYELTIASTSLPSRLAELHKMSVADILAEIAAWRDDDAPEYRRVLQQHGF